jgi:hypothetical protein
MCQMLAKPTIGVSPSGFPGDYIWGPQAQFITSSLRGQKWQQIELMPVEVDDCVCVFPARREDGWLTRILLKYSY